MMLSEAMQHFFERHIYLQHDLETIIYFMKIQFQKNIYFENTSAPPPWR